MQCYARDHEHLAVGTKKLPTQLLLAHRCWQIDVDFLNHKAFLYRTLSLWSFFCLLVHRPRPQEQDAAKREAAQPAVEAQLPTR